MAQELNLNVQHITCWSSSLNAIHFGNHIYSIEITEDNLGKETPFYQDWCKENLVRIDRQRYEIENQKKLKMAMKAIDIFEEKMQESLKENDRKEE